MDIVTFTPSHPLLSLGNELNDLNLKFDGEATRASSAFTSELEYPIPQLAETNSNLEELRLLSTPLIESTLLDSNRFEHAMPGQDTLTGVETAAGLLVRDLSGDFLTEGGLSEQSAPSEIVFIDPNVKDHQSLITGAAPGAQVIILDPKRDGIEQITETLAGHSGISSLHIVSHGEPGRLHLGAAQLSLDTVEHYAEALQNWAGALTAEADILLYGCDVAAGEQAMAFVQRVSYLTGADVAASNDRTGSTALGGDWNFELASGAIEANLAFQPQTIGTYNSILIASSAITEDFESDFSNWKKEVGGSHSAQMVNSPVRAGNQAVKFTLKKDDPLVSSSKRAELALGGVPSNSDLWYSFSVFLPFSYQKDPSSSEIIAQWHDRPDRDLGETWRSPALSLGTRNGKLYLSRRWDSNPLTENNVPEGKETIFLDSYQTGKWTDFAFHVKWSHTSDGLLEVWKDGELEVSRTGPNNYNDRRGPYFKIGMYKGDWKNRPERSIVSKRTIYFDEVSVGDARPTFATPTRS